MTKSFWRAAIIRAVRTSGQYTDLNVSGNTTAGMAQDF